MKPVSPFEKLGKLLGNITFTRHLRVEAEYKALESTLRRPCFSKRLTSPRPSN